MKNIFGNLDWTLAIPVLLGFVILAIAIVRFIRFRIADRRLIAVLRENKAKNQAFINEIQKKIQLNKEAIEDLNIKFANKEEFPEDLLIRKEALVKEYEDSIARLQKEHIETVLGLLKTFDSAEILKTIGSSSTEGERNYIDNLIRKSGILN